MKKRVTDDERACDDLATSLSQLSLDKPYICPQWLIDYTLFAGCAGELRELLRYTLVNEALHNVLTALGNAVSTSGLEEYFKTEEGAPIEARETFSRVFNEQCLPHKTNSYKVGCADDALLDQRLKRCVTYLHTVCELLDLEQLFFFLEIFSQLRVEPLTNPIVVAIHSALGALPTDEARLLALKVVDTSCGWDCIPDQRRAVLREIFWTRAARAAQEKERQRAERLPLTTAGGGGAPPPPAVVSNNDDDDDIDDK
jgi:hypothetical protein